jgi:uncharacterized protein (DUF433 family)
VIFARTGDFMITSSPAIVSQPGILGGTPVFSGTRVPVRILFEYLETGDSLDAFLEEFPSVSRELAIAALEQARMSVKIETRQFYRIGL